MPTSLRHALRSLKRTPVFTVAVILTLVLGIGTVLPPTFTSMGLASSSQSHAAQVFTVMIRSLFDR